MQKPTFRESPRIGAYPKQGHVVRDNFYIFEGLKDLPI